MPDLFFKLLSNPWFYLIAAALVWIARLAIRHTVRAAVDHRFAVRIEDHKHELQRIAEHERFDLQRRLAGASLYLQKQHTATAEVWAAVRVAHGFVARLFGVQRSLTLDDCNESDLRALMREYDVLDGKQDELIDDWKADRRRGAEAIKQHLSELRIPRAENKLQDARNLMYLDEIYFSDSAIVTLNKFVDVCSEWIARAMFPPQRCEKVTPLSPEALNEAMEHVHAALRSELSDPPRLRSESTRPDATPVRSDETNLINHIDGLVSNVDLDEGPDRTIIESVRRD